MKQRLEAGEYYHVYNFSNSGRLLFMEEENYVFFMQKLKQYLLPVMKVYCYSLMPNEFHLLVRIKAEEELILHFLEAKKYERYSAVHELRASLRRRRLLEISVGENGNNLRDLLEVEGLLDCYGLLDRDGLENRLKLNISKNISHMLSHQLSALFNSYAKALNKRQKTRGALFLKNFRRKRLTNSVYKRNLINYLHTLPQRKEVSSDFAIWSHSSFAQLSGDTPTFLERQEVIAWFGGQEFLQNIKIAA